MVEPELRTLGDRYALEGLLATGGMGRVWRGRDLLLDRPVAVKVLRSEYTGDPTFLARFRAEAQLTARLRHTNVAALYDYGESTSADGERLAYLVMELVEGEALSALLARVGRLSTERTLDVVGRTADALAAAHAAGIVHRDVKPGNVLLGDDGSVKITDFGVAWSASSVPLTSTGQVVGTAHYLSPEQAAGAKAGPASDVYALGMIAYECLAGRRAFDGDNPVQIALAQVRDEPDPLPDDVPGPVRTLVAHALVKDPARRLPDGAAFRAAVDDVRAGRALPPAPPPTSVFPVLPAVPAPRRRRLLVPVAALLLGAGIGVGLLEVAGGEATVPVAVADPGTGASAPPDDDGILVTAGPYLGRPVDEVETELAALGLRVQRAPQERVDVPAGLVVGLGPVGALVRGDLVTLTVATAPPVAPPSRAPAPPVPPVSPVGAGRAEPSPEVPGVAAGTVGGGSGPGGTGAAAVAAGAAADGDAGAPEERDSSDGDAGDEDADEVAAPDTGGGDGNGNSGNGNSGNGNGNSGNGNGRGNGNDGGGNGKGRGNGNG